MRGVYFIHIPKCGGTSVKEAFGMKTGHQTYRSLVDSLKDSYVENGFFFSFVRNPFDRLKSLYRFLVENNERGLKDRAVEFDEWFWKAVVENSPDYVIRTQDVWPCFQWVCADQKTIGVDFVGRVETFHRDWPKLCNMLSINAKLPHINRSSNVNANYELWMRDIVVEKYEKDLQLWYPNLLEKYQQSLETS